MACIFPDDLATSVINLWEKICCTRCNSVNCKPQEFWKIYARSAACILVSHRIKHLTVVINLLFQITVRQFKEKIASSIVSFDISVLHFDRLKTQYSICTNLCSANDKLSVIFFSQL